MLSSLTSRRLMQRSAPLLVPGLQEVGAVGQEQLQHGGGRGGGGPRR